MAWRLRTIVVEKFLDQVDMGENHPTTAIPFKMEFVKGVTNSRKTSPSVQALRNDEK
jgi:hypothetical protein